MPERQRTLRVPNSRTSKPPTAARHLIPLSEAADRASCSVKTLRRRIADGSLTGYRFGPKMLRVDADELDALMRPIPTVGGAA